MSYSINSYVASGSQTQFAVTFPYISKTHVEVRLNSVLTTAYTWASSGVIQLNTAPAAGVVVDIRRNTPKDARLINFQDASTLIERDLDMDSDQAFYLAQEAFDAVLNNISLDTDGLFDAKNKRVKNLADPVNAQDAVTKTWAETAMTSQLAQATAQATASANSAAASLVSKNAAAASATAAASSASTASTQATNAATSATAAATSASGALSSKNAAGISETNAATSATQAAGSATAASGSANSANTSAVGAAASATTATTKASEASSSATSASGSAATATTKASDATNSATAAATSATNAAVSATTATTKAGEAAASATSASGSASTATTKASEASASATSASGSATTATTKASEAAASAVSAANSAAAAATALDNFDDRYLGQKTADPTLDNDGMALLTGALYFNTTSGKMRVYTGSGWIDASSASVATLATFNYVATAGQTTFSGNDAAGVNLVYTVGAVIVTLNGIDQKNGVDYTATNGSSIVLTSAAAAGDELRVYAFGNFQVADTYSQAAADAKFVQKDASGNVGIVGKLDVLGGNSSTSDWGNVNLTSKNVVNAANRIFSALRIQDSGSGDAGAIGYSYNGSGYNMMLGTVPSVGGAITERVRIDSAGRVTMPYQPAFSARKTDYGVSTSGQIIAYNSVNNNVGNCYNSSTGRFTAPVSGLYYFVAFGICGQNPGSMAWGDLSILKNGGSPEFSGHFNHSDSWENTVVSGVVYLATNDYVQIQFTVGGGSPAMYQGFNGFSGFLIG